MSSVISINSISNAAILKSSPWSTFDKLWTSLKDYSADSFEFVPGKTPMATATESLLAVALYYVVIFGTREIMKKRPAFSLNGLFMAHNFILSVGSGALLVLFVEQIAPTWWNNGLYYCICGAGGWTNKLVTLYYLNYITKYIELLDTLFLVLKKKPLTFLHCYHHGATALLCYVQLAGDTSISWVPITLNLTVHVVMYWYYFQSARGIRVWWKQWITRLQIIQFVIDLGFIYFALWQWYASTFNPSLPHVGTCAGKEFAAFTGAGILSSYLLLFILFYAATYKRSSKNRSVAKIAANFDKANKGDIGAAAKGMKWHAKEGMRLRD